MSGNPAGAPPSPPDPPPPHPMFEGLEPYVPGEQPGELGFVKLNTNEFPYPAAPGVIEAIRNEAADSVRLYPSPRCAKLRETLAHFHGVPSEMIFVGNGSDEVLRILIQAYGGVGRSVGVVDPTYSLYASLVAMTGAELRVFDLERGVDIPEAAFRSGCDLFLLPTPNAPLGNLFPARDLERLAAAGGLLVLDEAYIDFAGGVDHFDLMRRHANVVLCRTFSKAYGLAGMRVGYAVADPRVIGVLSALADSYNVNRVSQAAARAAIESVAYYREKMAETIRNREWLADQMRGLGFIVGESKANFSFARHARARELYEALKARKILVRYFDREGLRDGLRVTIGLRGELDAMLGELKTALVRPNFEPDVLKAGSRP